MLKEHPSVANISVGSLYLYDRRREQRARKLDQTRAAKLAKYLDKVRAAALKAVVPNENLESNPLFDLLAAPF